MDKIENSYKYSNQQIRLLLSLEKKKKEFTFVNFFGPVPARTTSVGLDSAEFFLGKRSLFVMDYVYVIESINFGNCYKGMTKNLEQRLREHNSGKTRSNKAFAPFKIVYFEEFEDAEQARKREKYFKTSAGRKYLQKKGIRPHSSAE